MESLDVSPQPRDQSNKVPMKDARSCSPWPLHILKCAPIPVPPNTPIKHLKKHPGNPKRSKNKAPQLMATPQWIRRWLTNSPSHQHMQHQSAME